MHKNTVSYFFSISFLIFAQIMVATNIVVSKYLIESIPMLFLLMVRFGFASIILFSLHWIIPTDKKKLSTYFAQLNRRDWVFILAQSLTAGVLFNCFMLLGLHYTDANVAGIITSALPMLIAILSWRFLGEKFSRTTKYSVIIATVGLVVIAIDNFKGISLSHSFLGDFFVFLSLIPEALYYILCKLHPNRLPLFLVSSLLNGINALILLCIVPMMPMSGFSLSINDWSILAALGLSSGLFYVFWFMGCQRVDGMLVSLSTAIMPVATVLLAMLILGEKLTFLQAIGMGLVMLSILIHVKIT